MTGQDVLLAIADGTLGPAVCARDLPVGAEEGSRLLRRAWRDGLLHRLLPGVYCAMRRCDPIGRDVPAASHSEAATAYGRLHRRMVLPAPAAAANMVGLSEQVPSATLLVWPGPARRFRGTVRLELSPMPDWAAARTADPAIPFLLALSSWSAAWDASDLEGLARRLGPDLSRAVAATRRAGLPRPLALCLARFARATVRTHGPLVPPENPREIVEEAAAALSPARPFDRCRSVSARLVARLAQKGVPARMLRCSGWRGDATAGEDPRWSRVAPPSRVHYVVHVPDLDIVVDATWRQFDTSADPVRIGTPATASSEWDAIDTMEGTAAWSRTA